MTPYVAVHFGFGHECIFDPFFVSNPVGDSIMSRKVYRGCIVSIYGRKALVDLIELNKVDFDVILGWIDFTRAMHLLIVGLERSVLNSLMKW